MGCVESLEKSYHDIGMPNQNDPPYYNPNSNPNPDPNLTLTLPNNFNRVEIQDSI